MADRDQRQVSVDERRRQRRESRRAQTWRVFVTDLCSQTRLDEESATLAAVSVLCHLEERLTGDEARDLESQLPTRMRELLDGVCTERDTIHKLHRPQFIAQVALDLGKSDTEAEVLTRAVFATVRSWISDGESNDVLAQLPRDLRPLWMQPA